jgi:hypothetical protein
MISEVPKSFTLGFLLFTLTEASWLALGMFKGSNGSRWVMEPTPSLVVTVVVHFVGALVFAALVSPRVRGFVAFAVGVVVAVAFTLGAVGPGNLWPIVVAIDSVILVPTLTLAFFLGALLTPRSPHAA